MGNNCLLPHQQTAAPATGNEKNKADDDKSPQGGRSRERRAHGGQTGQSKNTLGVCIACPTGDRQGNVFFCTDKNKRVTFGKTTMGKIVFPKGPSWNPTGVNHGERTTNTAPGLENGKADHQEGKLFDEPRNWQSWWVQVLRPRPWKSKCQKKRTRNHKKTPPHHQ